MAIRSFGSVDELELNELKDFFNATNNRGIKTRFFEESGIRTLTLDRVLLTGRGELRTIQAIRDFKKNYKAEVI